MDGCRGYPPLFPPLWPSRDIVITNLVWCMAYKRELQGSSNFFNSRAIVWQQCGKSRRAGKMKGRLIRAQTTRCKKYLV